MNNFKLEIHKTSNNCLQIFSFFAYFTWRYLEDHSIGALADLLDLDEVVEADRVLAVHVGAKEGTEDDATTKFLLASLLPSFGPSAPYEKKTEANFGIP